LNEGSSSGCFTARIAAFDGAGNEIQHRHSWRSGRPVTPRSQKGVTGSPGQVTSFLPAVTQLSLARHVLVSRFDCAGAAPKSRQSCASFLVGQHRQLCRWSTPDPIVIAGDGRGDASAKKI